MRVYFRNLWWALKGRKLVIAPYEPELPKGELPTLAGMKVFIIQSGFAPPNTMYISSSLYSSGVFDEFIDKLNKEL